MKFQSTDSLETATVWSMESPFNVVIFSGQGASVLAAEYILFKGSHNPAAIHQGGGESHYSAGMASGMAGTMDGSKDDLDQYLKNLESSTPGTLSRLNKEMISRYPTFSGFIESANSIDVTGELSDHPGIKISLFWFRDDCLGKTDADLFQIAASKIEAAIKAVPATADLVVEMPKRVDPLGDYLDSLDPSTISARSGPAEPAVELHEEIVEAPVPEEKAGE